MLIEKPANVRHDGTASKDLTTIYGIDAHPQRLIFATAGGDNHVKLWSLESPLDSAAIQPESQQSIADFKLISVISEHQQAVNCVRWASHGTYLASGSDDQLVLIYQKKFGDFAPTHFGLETFKMKENWTRVATLKRHTMNVQDVAWSPDDRMLASCSIDNTILIWNVEAAHIRSVMTEPLRTLNGHHSWVKGVAWDPVGKYLSSAGEDKTIRVWKTDSWEQVNVISEPFESCASSSHFRRLCWSPDGSVLCATHAFSSKQNVAALLSRTTWTSKLSLVGHEGVITCSRFNRRLFKEMTSQNSQEYACCAVGSDDATISIWLARLARPLVVVTECFSASVTDISWSCTGYVLLAASLDGSVCCFKLEDAEIGQPITWAQQSTLLQAKYGVNVGTTQVSSLIENPMQLQMEERLVHQSNGDKPCVHEDPSQIIEQIEPEKRLVNVLLPISKRDRLNQKLPAEKNTNATLSAANSTLVQPEFTSKRSSLAVTSDTVPSIDLQSEESSSTSMPVIKSAESLKGSARTLHDAASTILSSSNLTKRKKSDQIYKRKRNKGSKSAREVAIKQLRRRTHTRYILPELPARVAFIHSVPTIRKADHLDNRTMSTSIDLEVTVTNIHVEEDESITECGPVYSTIQCQIDNRLLWIDRLPGRGVCATGNELFFGVGLNDGQLFVFSQSGHRLFPCILLSSAISVMECSRGNSPYLLVVLVNGQIHEWDIQSKKKVLSESIEGIISCAASDSKRKVTLLRCRVTTEGLLIITLAISKGEGQAPSSLESFIYSKNMASWMRVADDSFGFSDFNTSLPCDLVSGDSTAPGLLRQLQSASCHMRAQRGVASAMLSVAMDPFLQNNLTRSHLQHQIAAAEALCSFSEYRHWLVTYAKFLAQEEDASRLDELCASLLRPKHTVAINNLSPSKPSNPRDDSIMEISGCNLLRNHILPTIACYRSMQRLVAKHQIIIEELDQKISKTDI